MRSRQQAGARPGMLEREAGLDLVRGQATHWSSGKQSPLLILDLRLFALLFLYSGLQVSITGPRSV